MKVLRWIGMVLGGLAVLALLVGVAARFNDGPIVFFPGGPFVEGEWVTDPRPDWSFARDLPSIEMQTLSPARSRRVWVLVLDDALYVPCGLPQVKSWPDYVADDPRVLLRIEGRLYERQAVRISDPELLARLAAENERKYGYGASTPEDFENLWFYRMEPRPAA